MQKHEQWLHKAKIDLLVASQALKDNNEEIFEGVIYHTQQSAEKSLKAFLVFHRLPIIKTHDLERLLLFCEELDKDFKSLVDMAEMLNPFASAYRYPIDDFDDIQTPTREDMQNAVQAAQKIFDFVVNKIMSLQVAKK